MAQRTGRAPLAAHARREFDQSRAEARARPRVIGPRELAFSIIAAGSEPGKAEHLFVWNDLEQGPNPI